MRSLLVEKYRERQDRKLKERDAQWRRAWQERLPGDPLPPFVDDDTDNDRKQ